MKKCENKYNVISVSEIKLLHSLFVSCFYSYFREIHLIHYGGLTTQNIMFYLYWDIYIHINFTYPYITTISYKYHNIPIPCNCCYNRAGVMILHEKQIEIVKWNVMFSCEV